MTGFSPSEPSLQDADEDYVAMPPFGRSDADYADVAAFYRNWLEFCSRKARLKDKLSGRS